MWLFHHALPFFLHWCSLLLTRVEERELSKQLRAGVYSLDNVGQAVLQLCCEAHRKPGTLACLANLCICERDMLLVYVCVCCVKSNDAVLFQQESLPVRPTSSSRPWSWPSTPWQCQNAPFSIKFLGSSFLAMEWLRGLTQLSISAGECTQATMSAELKDL